MFCSSSQHIYLLSSSFPAFALLGPLKYLLGKSLVMYIKHGHEVQIFSHTPLGAIVKLTAAHSFNSKEIATFSLSNIDASSLVIHNYLMFEFCNVPFSIHCSPCTCTWLLVFAPALTGTKGS